MVEKTEQTYIDKSSWPDGVWKNEPDRVSWVDKETGYSCLIRRNSKLGIFCGYVAVEKIHPFYEAHYDDIAVDIHGSLTFSSECDGDVDKGICHLTNNDDSAWWFGFDCNHEPDYAPGHESLLRTAMDGDMVKNILTRFPKNKCMYRDLSYVTSEVESLAKQLKEIESKKTCRRDNNEIS